MQWNNYYEKSFNIFSFSKQTNKAVFNRDLKTVFNLTANVKKQENA